MMPDHRTLSSKQVICDDPDYPTDDGGWMQFHLTYEGKLLGASRDDPRTKHKHEIRRVFHRQLKQLWDVTWLADQKHGIYEGFEHINPDLPLRDGLAHRYQRGPYRFVPLVTMPMALLCSVDILFLRPDPPGSVIRSADIDSRLKTLFDALKMPAELAQLGPFQTPDEGEDPFYCLLEDDKLITHVSVTTSTLLEPTRAGLGKNDLKNDARLVLDVKVRPHRVTWGNIGFGS